MPWIVYETRNLVSGKNYVGVHRQDGEGFDGYLGSGKALEGAIAKYGREAFSRRTLFVFDTPQEAYAKETEIVGQPFIDSTWTYNVKHGGHGGGGHSLNEEARDKIRQYRTGRRHSEETKEKIRQKLLRRTRGTLPPETRAKMSASRTGVPHTEERRRNISEAMKRVWRLRKSGGRDAS